MDNQKNINAIFIEKFKAQEEKIKDLETRIEIISFRLDNQEKLIKNKNKKVHTFISV
jgi:hypothetical protein